MGLVRIVLALSVVVWHMPEPPLRLLNAAVAVVCFFIISGFYMAMVINEKYARDDGVPWIAGFYRARLLRLYPAYFFVLLLMIVWFRLTHSPTPFTRLLPMPLVEQVSLVLLNVFVIGQDLHQTIIRSLDQGSGPSFLIQVRDAFGEDYFRDSAMMVGQAWSLSSEFLFYLMAPFVVRSWRRTAVVLVAALAVRWVLIGVLGYRSGIWGYWFFPGAVCLFLLGSAAYHLRRALPGGEWQRWLGRLAMLVLAMWFVGNVAVHGIVMPSNAEGAIDGTRFWVLYVTFALSIPFIFECTKHWYADRVIGELSYPLYLIHGLVVGLVYHRWAAPHGVAPDALAALSLSILAAWAVNVGIEAPIEMRRYKLAMKFAPPQATNAI
jgi:peptidoglycan/LPS O-acetylase OafA/YrhL